MHRLKTATELAYASLFLVVPALFVPACGDLRVDESASDRPPSGVIRGTVLYQGPRPCTRDGHVVGNAVLLLFDRANPPPPLGIATTALNLGVVAGDVLFANEPRVTGEAIDCPADRNDTTIVRASAPFTVSPAAAGSYVVQAFFDLHGEFLPTFKIRNLPRAGDVAGGALDTADALAHAADPSYAPKFLPVDVGLAQPLAEGAPADTIPTFTMPPAGFVRDNVSVTLGAVLGLPRPYFYAAGSEAPAVAPAPTPQNPETSFDPELVPVLTMPQDLQLLAPPDVQTPDNVAAYQARFPGLRLIAGVPDAERAVAADPAQPFHFDVASKDSTAFAVFRDGMREIPEGQGVPKLWPTVVLTKLVDDPGHAADRQSLAVQGSSDARKVSSAAAQPIVVVQGLTLAQDSLLTSVLSPPSSSPTTENRADHVTVLVRPAVVCFDPRHVDRGGVLVTPHLTGPSADPSEAVPKEGKPLFDVAAVKMGMGKLVRDVQRGCLPLGRYAINAVYPSGQAWTVPNEAGSCEDAEGRVDDSTNPGACLGRPRPVLRSQGTRAVVEIVPAADPTTCSALAAADPSLGADGVPRACVALSVE